MLKIGEKAPNFSAECSDGKIFRLDDLQDKKHLILYFYPQDFTPGCTKEAKIFRDNYEQIKKYNAEIIGVSMDSNKTHQEFINQCQLPFRLISDMDKSLSKLFKVTNFWGLVPLAKRVTYIIDKNGYIRNISHYEININAHLKDIIETLKNIENDI